MGYSIVVDSSNFEKEVIQKSYEKPVLIDFFATWCGPCKLLKPILEKLLKEYDFILATIDIDRQSDLAKQFGVEGVPDVKVAFQGEFIQGFVGVLSEQEIREFLKQFNLQSDFDLKVSAMIQAKESGNNAKAKQLLDELFNTYPNNPQLILEAASFLIHVNRLQEAEQMLNTIETTQKHDYGKAQGMKTLIQFKQILADPGESELDKLFAKAAELTLLENYQEALKLFLQLVETSRQYREDGARKAMISIFNLLGSDHLLTKQYQRELMLVLY
ncbi:MAG: tetratricopeptide repeat protein [Cyanobacteria bacterium P01_G01_bin.49]